MIDAAGAGTPAGQKEVLAGRYRLVRRLAEGGMATVWEGRDEILARPVAIKIPHAQMAADPAARERFRREAVSAARLAHPGIVATYDTGADGPTDFIVMELVRGRTVRDLVAEGPVAAGVAVPLVAQVAEALDVAHRAGLIHRDIKPANLLLVEDGPAPRVKVADFGVARAQEELDHRLSASSVTREGVVVGTARYLAPEQVAARPLDGRTDIYAVGCVLHELLAGAPPFVRENDLAIALAHLTEAPLALRSLGVPVDPALEGLVLACLAKDPAKRPASASVLAHQLRALAATPAGPPTAAIPAVAGAPLDWTPAAGTVALPAPAPPDPGGAAANAHAAPAPAPWADAASFVAAPALPAPGNATVVPAPPAPGAATVVAAPDPATAALPATAPPLAPPQRQPAPPRPVAAGSSAPARGRGTGGPAHRRRRHGTRAVRRPTPSRAPLVVVGGLVLAALATALAVVVLPTSRPARVVGSPETTVATGPFAIAGLRSFDPAPGDGKENDDQLPRLTDDNPATTWSSDRYRQPPVFGNLKKGVGVIVSLRQPARLAKLRVRSPSRAWAAQVYVAAAAAPTLSGWGQPVARASGVEGDLELDLDGETGGAVLLWFTDPGRTGQVVVGDLELQPR